jgi:hypothetical protein
MAHLYLVKDDRDGRTIHVFTFEKPRQAGYPGPATPVDLEYDMAVHEWPEGTEAPAPVLGNAKAEGPSRAFPRYEVFRNERACRENGYEPLEGEFVVIDSWFAYLRLFAPGGQNAEHWFEQLDQIDDAARSRGQRPEEPDEPQGASRDEVAAWIAKQHLAGDSSIRQILHLPTGADPDEIRFIEVSDRLVAPDSWLTPTPVAVDVRGKKYRLLVVDASSEQLERMKHDAALLPHGWRLSGAGEQVWRRGHERTPTIVLGSSSQRLQSISVPPQRG